MVSRTAALAHADVAAYVERRTGLRFAGSQAQRLHEAIAPRLAPGHRRPIVEELLDEETFGQLCEELTIQESYFFREAGTLAVIRDRFLPSRSTRSGPLRVWSAGCAMGEEAYSLAILLTESGLAGRYCIFGTDLSEAAIDAAGRGQYTRWSVRGVEEHRLPELFEVTGSRYQVRDRFRKHVSFFQHNLLEPRPSDWHHFDLVLCRNVLIYLAPDAVRAVLASLTAALAPGGWLVLGVSDPLAYGLPGLDAVVTEHGLVYRRCVGTANADVPPMPTSGTPARAGRSGSPPQPGRAPHQDRPHACVDLTRPGPGSFPRTVKPQTPKEPDDQLDDVVAAAQRELLAARPDRAEELARRVLGQASGDRRGHLLLVQALTERGHKQEAVAAAERAVESFADDVEVRHLHAVALLGFGNAAEALVVARQAVYLGPAYAPAHLALARAHELLGNTVQAERARRNGCRLLQVAGES